MGPSVPIGYALRCPCVPSASGRDIPQDFVCGRGCSSPSIQRCSVWEEMDLRASTYLGDPVAAPATRRHGWRLGGRFRRRILGLTIISMIGVGLSPTSVSAASTFYVDCSSGSDGNSGTSTSSAWRSVSRANAAPMTPGSRLLFKRGCTWSGTALLAKWIGTSTSPITIGAYGSGNRPLFQNAQDQVYIRGSWLVIEGLAARADPVTRDTQCENAPAGRRTGFRLVAGAQRNILRDLTADDLFIGIWVDRDAHHNTVRSNVLRNNRMKSDNWTSDAGAVGISLIGDDNEIAYNTISGSDVCSRFYGRDGSAVEVYGGQRNRIHHNRAINNNNFTELGNPRSSDNTFAYNVVTSTLRDGHFLTTRGGSDTKYGPVYRTKAYNNTVYLPGAAAYAVQCVKGCNSSILSFRNNIIWSADRIGYADGAFDEGNNIYWTPGGQPKIYFPTSSSSRRVDPRWVAPGSNDFHLQSGSPAVNTGSNAALQMGFNLDFDGVGVPQGGTVDIGAFERGSSSSPPPPPPTTTTVASDAFSRTVSNGWGNADLGGAYTHFGSSASFAVQGGAGLMRMSPDQSRGATLFDAPARDLDVRLRLSTDVVPAGDGNWIYLVTRRSTDGSEYRTKLRLLSDGRVLVGISRTSGGVESPIAVEAVSGVSFSAGSYLEVRASVTGSGPTTLRLKVWRSGQAEPSAWNVTSTDGTGALQDAGAVALLSYLPGNGRSATLRFDDLVVRRP